MATKVGEGYIEIKPKLVGFNRDLLRDARKRIKEIEEASKEAVASVAVKPKITGVTKIWQREIQQELDSKIDGLTVDVKVHLENRDLKATFKGFTVEARNAGKESAEQFRDGFSPFVESIRRDMRETEIAVKRGLKPFADPEVIGSIKNTGSAIDSLATDTESLSNRQVTALRSVVNEHKRLNTTVSSESKKATTEYEKSIEAAIRATDRIVEKLSSQRVLADTKGAWGLARSLDAEIRDAEKVADALFPDLNERIGNQGTKAAGFFTSAFGRHLKSNFLDNVSESLLALGGRFALALVSAQPLIGALSNLSAGLLELGTVAVDVYGAFLALPAVWAAVAQAGAVLTAAFFGIQDALSAVQNEQQHAAANAATQARQIAQAQEQVSDAKERLKRSIESANDSIKRSEDAVGEAMFNAAKRVSDAQERVSEAVSSAAEAVQSANERIADAQKSLSRAYESAADRIISAEKRHADSIKRVRDAQLDLNQAYKDAMERFEDLNIALGNAILDEEGAKIAIERAKQRLDETLADPNASDLDKREAELAYREALHRLQEIQEKNEDLKKEIEEANKTGVEGSKEVTDAKQKLLDAQQAEIEAQQDIAKAHQDAAEQIMDAQQRVADAQADAVKAQLDGAKRIQEAEQALAEARAEGAKDVEKAQENLAKAHSDAARTIAAAQKDVKRAIDGLTEAQTKQNAQFFNAQYALSQLSPEAQKFVMYLADVFIPKMKEVQFSIQDAFFPPIQRALEQSGGLIDLFQAKLTTTAGIFGGLIGKTIEWLETPEAANSLGVILDTNNRLFELLGEAGLNFGDALLTVAQLAGPFLEDMGRLVLDFSQWVRDITDSKNGRDELAQFFANVSETVGKLYDTAKLVGDALYEVYKRARPFGQDLLDDIKDIAKRFDEWVHSTEGSTQIEKFLANGKRFLEQVLKLIEDVAKAFFDFGASNDLSGLIESLRTDLLPALLNVIDAFGGGSEGGGFIFLIKAVTVSLNLLAGTVSLVAALISGLGAIFTGDWSGARDSFADFLDSVRGNAQTVFGDLLPQNFAESSRAFNDSVRGMNGDRENLSTGFNELNNSTTQWSYTTTDLTGKVADDYRSMSSDVATSTDQYRNDVDSKTKDATGKADANSKAAKEAILRHMDQMRSENETQMEKYRKTVDDKTKDAKDASNRNIGDIVRDATTLLVPFSSVFRTAGEKAQEAIRKPGADWYSVGKAVIDGLWEGVKNFIPNFLTSIWNLGVDIVNTIRKALDSNSPSKKMIAVGKGVGEGLAIGVESMTSKVSRASQNLAKSVTDSFGGPTLEVDVGSSGRKVVPTIGAVDVSGLGGGSRVYNTTVYAAPTVPTEKQISNVLKYQEALYS